MKKTYTKASSNEMFFTMDLENFNAVKCTKLMLNELFATVAEHFPVSYDTICFAGNGGSIIHVKNGVFFYCKLDGVIYSGRFSNTFVSQ